MPLSRRTFFSLGGGALLAPALVSGTDAAAPLAAPEPGTGSRRPLPDDIRQRLQALMDTLKVPSFAVAGVKNGETVYADAFGHASLPFGVPASERTLYNLGSIGKHFTAAIVLKQVEAGKISLDRPIGDYLKDIPKQYARCPVHSLLSHTSGIPTYDNLPGMEGDRPVSRDFFMKSIGGLNPDFAPGDAWAYSNTGFVILGRMVEDVTGRTYRQAINEDLVVPAGFQEGRVDDAGAIIAGRAEPYSCPAEEIRHARQMDGEFSGWPDGGMIVSARDAALWEIGLQNGKPIPNATLKRMIDPAILSTGHSAGYGFALFTDFMCGHRMHYHSGSVDGFIAFWLRLPDQGVGVAVMVNLDNERAHGMRRAATFMTAELMAPGATCYSLKPLHDDDPALTERTRKIFADGAKPGDKSIFAPEIANMRLGTAFVQATGLDQKIDVNPGDFVLVEAFDDVGGAHVRRYRVTQPTYPIHYDVGYDARGRIFRIRDI